MANHRVTKKQRRDYLAEMWRQRCEIRELKALLEQYKVDPPQPEPPKIEVCRALFCEFAESAIQKINTCTGISEEAKDLISELTDIVYEIRQEQSTEGVCHYE